MNIRTLIVDDEALARRRLTQLLRDFPSVQIIGESADGIDAFEKIRTLEPDLVFLDVQMPECDGFGVLQRLSTEHLPSIVFTTAYDHHAVLAFEQNALDYLVKPITSTRFRTTLERVLRHFELKEENASAKGILRLLADTNATQEDPQYANRLTIRHDDKVIVLKVSEIDSIESAGNYVAITAGKATHIHRDTLGGLEKQLNPKTFFRISRSAIVNLDRVQELQPMFRGESVLVLADGRTIKVTRRLRDLEQALRFG